MIIRPYRPEDRAAINACIVQMQDFERAIDVRSLTGAAVAEWYLPLLEDHNREKDGHLLVAECDGAVVGFANLQANVLCEDYDEENYHYALISELSVLDSHRNRGIGRALIAAAEALARERGARWLRIDVLARNDGARHLYGACGFDERIVELEKVLEG